MKELLDKVVATFDGKKTYTGIGIMWLTFVIDRLGLSEVVLANDVAAIVNGVVFIAGAGLAIFGRLRAKK